MKVPEFDDKWKEAYIKHASGDGYFGPFNWDEIIPKIKWELESLYDENGDLIENSPHIISSTVDEFDNGGDGGTDNEETGDRVSK